MSTEHELMTRVSDNTQTLWLECTCGFETAFYTISGDGKDAMEAAREEGNLHLNPPQQIELEPVDVKVPKSAKSKP